MSTDPVVIIGLARTPMGAFQGAFSSVSAPELGAVAIKAAMSEAKVEGSEHRTGDYGLCPASWPRPGASASSRIRRRPPALC